MTEVKIMIVLKNATLAYTKDYDALLDINLTIDTGERIGIVGERGSGKTALLRVIAGLEVLKCGQVYINDLPIKKVKFFNDVNLGYITTNATFFEKKTVYDNFAWILKTRKVPKRDREARVRAVLDEFELSYLADMRVNSLSPLERRQVQIARLALRPVDIVLCDQIFDGEDKDIVDQTKKCLQILLNREPKQKTVIMACEDEKLIADMVDKVYHIDGGSIVELADEK